MSAQRSPSHLEGRPVYLWITSLLPTGPTGQAGDLWTTSLLPTDPQPYRDCDDRTARGAGRLVSSRSDLWEDGTWSRASMLRPRSLYPSVQLTLELVGCSINAGTLPVTYVSGPDISILPNHRTFLICLDRLSGGWTVPTFYPATGIAISSRRSACSGPVLTHCFSQGVVYTSYIPLGLAPCGATRGSTPIAERTKPSWDCLRPCLRAAC